MTGGHGWRTARALRLPEPDDVVTIKEELERIREQVENLE